MIKRFLKFGIRGIAGGFIDSAVLFLLTEFLFKNYFQSHIIAPAISFEMGVICTYYICYKWIWHHRVHHHVKDFFKRFFPYNFASLFSFFIKISLLNLFAVLFDFHVVICNLMALFFSGFFTFFASEEYIFKKIQFEIPEDNFE